MTKALVSPLLYWGSLSKEYPLHHNHTQPTKFSSEFRKLHVKNYTIVLKAIKTESPITKEDSFTNPSFDSKYCIAKAHH